MFLFLYPYFNYQRNRCLYSSLVVFGRKTICLAITSQLSKHQQRQLQASCSAAKMTTDNVSAGENKTLIQLNKYTTVPQTQLLEYTAS